jgi:hypothetical protein
MRSSRADAEYLTRRKKKKGRNKTTTTTTDDGTSVLCTSADNGKQRVSVRTLTPVLIERGSRGTARGGGRRQTAWAAARHARLPAQTLAPASCQKKNNEHKKNAM